MLEKAEFKVGEDNNKIVDIARALSSYQRLEILNLLNSQSRSVKELAEILHSPMSTTLLNVNILEECNLIYVKDTVTKKGRSKLCSRNCDDILVNIFRPTKETETVFSMSIPIGSYVSYDIPKGTGCGIATEKHTIGIDNDTDIFFNEERFKAGYIWFNQGFLTYRISNKNLPTKLKMIKITFEVCSEAPFYRNDWKSDITMTITDKEVGTWTSLGDYGGRRGNNNPSWWPDALTQFGVLTSWEIRKDGTFVNSVKISDFTIDDLEIQKHPYIDLTIGVKKDAHYCGGMSLFGKTFGDYSQDINISFYW